MKTTHILQSIGLITVTALMTLVIQGSCISPDKKTSPEVSNATSSPDGMDPFIGEITMFGGNFAPKDWAFCNGQLLSIDENQALFSLLGTMYGGDGRNTFGLPDLRGRVAIHQGSGPGLSAYRQGQKGGSENVALPLQERAITFPEVGRAGINVIQMNGANQVDVRQPYLAVNYIIALKGTFPQRN